MIAYILPKNQKKVTELRVEYNTQLDIKWDCWERMSSNNWPHSRAYRRDDLLKHAAQAAHDRMMECEEKINALTEFLEVNYSNTY